VERAIRDRLDSLVEEGVLQPTFRHSFLELYRCYCDEAGVGPATHHFTEYLQLMEEQLRSPHQFEAIHRRWTEPFDHYLFGLRQAELMVDQDTSLVKCDIVSQIKQQLASGENAIILSNHQTELDCHLVGLLLGKIHPEFTYNLIWVAGDRVVNDPIAVPLSLGLNLICIYSKKHINHPPEKREEKLTHNRRAMRQVRELLSEGGHCIVLFPSGGRDRPNEQGEVIPAPFDPAAIELFRLVGDRSGHKTHFYPMALNTYAFMPPPPEIGQELGESRVCRRAGVGISIGKEIDFEELVEGEEEDKHARRERIAEKIWAIVNRDYKTLIG
jgi:glycerol-3-phosphate O-acyltransferase